MNPRKEASSTPTNSSSDLMVVKKEKTMMMVDDDGGRRDLISELPEPILHHILSYLDMTHVIQTSLLSKKWRYIWASLSILNLDYKVYATLFKKVRFPFFVTQVLMFRNHNSNIDLFRVSYRSINDHTIMNHISTWIHLLIRSNVKLIDFHVALRHLESLPQFPTCLFTSKSLTTLKLDNGGHMFSPPSTAHTVSLPAVKTLHLKSLKLLNSVEMLISTSPVLETLIIDTCCLWGSEEFTISNDQLKSLVIEKTVGISGDQGRVNVFAPKLESFISKGVFKHSNRYAFVKVPSLVHAEFDTNVDNVTAKNEEKIENVIWCLRGIYNLKSLILSVWLLELVIEVPERLQSLQIRPFHNLSYLQLKTSFSKSHACAIMFLLGKCPNLGTLVLKVTEIPPPKSVAKAGSVSVEEEGFWEAELAPQCNMHHLKLVEIWDVVANVNELEFLKFLLKNATGLEKMVVFTPMGQFLENDKRFKGFVEKLISFRGASWSVQIVFV